MAVGNNWRASHSQNHKLINIKNYFMTLNRQL